MANVGAVGIISGGADGTYIRIAAELANVLDGATLRVIPMIGPGSLQNLQAIAPEQQQTFKRFIESQSGRVPSVSAGEMESLLRDFVMWRQAQDEKRTGAAR